jgi:hypothetical protein
MTMMTRQKPFNNAIIFDDIFAIVASLPSCHCQLLPPLLPPPLPPDSLSLLPKEEAVAPPAAAYQQQHQGEKIYKSRQLGLILTYLQYLKSVMLVKGI